MIEENANDKHEGMEKLCKHNINVDQNLEQHVSK